MFYVPQASLDSDLSTKNCQSLLSCFATIYSHVTVWSLRFSCNIVDVLFQFFSTGESYFCSCLVFENFDVGKHAILLNPMFSSQSTELGSFTYYASKTCMKSRNYKRVEIWLNIYG